jgi:hypothetical protein
MTNKERAITIAIGMFLIDWEDTEVETYEKLCAEPEGKMWHQIDYATTWCVFEDDQADDVIGNITELAEQIEHALNEVSK